MVWSNLIEFCVDGAPTMISLKNSVAKLVKQKAPECVVYHCMIHRLALASKVMPEILTERFEIVTKVINIIKKSALNSRIFSALCGEDKVQKKSFSTALLDSFPKEQ